MVSSLRFEVVRHYPRERGEFKGLVGSISATIESLSYLHVGSTKEQVSIDEAKVKRILSRYNKISIEAMSEIQFEEKYSSFHMTGGFPSIPGASVKGNVRSRIELSLRMKNGKSRSCFIRAILPWRVMSNSTYYKIWGEVLKEDRSPCDHTRNEPVCLVCDLFGTSGLASLISFSDFIGKEVGLKPLDEYGLKILTAPPGSKLHGRIDFFNLEPHELGLLFIGMGLKSSRSGRSVLLGKFKYRTKMGRVRFCLENLKLLEYSKPVRLNNVTVKAGEILSDEKLDNFVDSLVSKAMKAFEGEIEIKDEVSIIEKI